MLSVWRFELFFWSLLIDHIFMNSLPVLEVILLAINWLTHLGVLLLELISHLGALLLELIFHLSVLQLELISHLGALILLRISHLDSFLLEHVSSWVLEALRCVSLILFLCIFVGIKTLKLIDSEVAQIFLDIFLLIYFKIFACLNQHH